MTMNYAMKDLIFQAHCQIDYLNGYAEEGARLDGHEDGSVELELSDGSFTTIYLEPIKQLVAALEALPAPSEAA